MKEPYRITFGKYKGRYLDKVPLKYLDWLVGQEWMGFKYPEDTRQIKEYLADPCIAKELEAELRQDDEEEE